MREQMTSWRDRLWLCQRADYGEASRLNEYSFWGIGWNNDATTLAGFL